MKEVPEALNKIVDVVLRYRPKSKSEAAQKRGSPKPKPKKAPKKTTV